MEQLVSRSNRDEPAKFVALVQWKEWKATDLLMGIRLPHATPDPLRLWRNEYAAALEAADASHRGASPLKRTKYAGVAKTVRQGTANALYGGSIPSTRSKHTED